MTMKTARFAAIVLLSAHLPAASVAQPQRPTSIFNLEADEFWLNLQMIFFTAGEAVRRVAPEHVTSADTFDISRTGNGGLGPFRPALEEVWRPSLDGRGTRDQALAALIARIAA